MVSSQNKNSNTELSVLIVDDEPDIVSGMEQMLGELPLDVSGVSDAQKARNLISEKRFEIIISDIAMPDVDGFELLELAIERDPDVVFIMITGYGSVESAVSAMRAGAYHYLQKPYTVDDMLDVVRLAMNKAALTKELRRMRNQVSETHTFHRLLGRSPKMKELLDLIRKIAPTDATVLILGESGTGKELTARAIHEMSRRTDQPFIAINTAALPESLLEAELFGYRRGAFTGADRDKRGLFEVSSGGSLFLDEIGSMPPNFQGKLLRALQEREIIPVGGTEPVPFDSRIISATNVDIKQAVAREKFREDLYFRLNVIEVKIPPLRERRGDIPLLAEFLVQKYSEQQLLPFARKLSQAALEKLASYRWPGNVRELENVIQRAVVISESETISAADLSIEAIPVREKGDEGLYTVRYADAKARVFGDFQREYASRLLKRFKGNISQASRESGLTRAALYQIIRKYNLKI
ncbi:MAG: sigma-54-dependent Fis family transcriptional regulator [Planctomycetota bacterium]|nr:MAG: sigma-54-dependent Fis family transcriptional regulator [Planctomycetota bacterium]